MPLRRKICFIANDYDFMFRHFAPAIAAAEDCGLGITAYLPKVQAATREPPPNVAVVSSPIDRSISALGLLEQARWLIAQLRNDRPDIVVAFSVRTALALSLALPFVKIQKIVIYVTGLGLLELLDDWKSRARRAVAYAMLRLASHHRDCCFIFENHSDSTSLGFRPGYPKRQILLVGAGVDPNEFAPREWPTSPPVRFATASRLVWSKGLDIAVQAISALVEEGHPVELSVYGAPDPANPLSVDPSEWDGLPGITFRGFAANMAEVWARHHAAIFASRGGEGTPRSLLEAASCGRPCIITDVPGCREFIRDGIEGFVAKPDSVVSLKEAILTLLNHRHEMHKFGDAARNRVLQTSTFEITRKKYRELFCGPAK